MGRSIGLDVHRDFCEVAIADGGRAHSAGRVATTPKQLELFAQSLAPTDRVVMEATGNALAISHARIKTAKVDAKVVADRPAEDRSPAAGRRHPDINADQTRATVGLLVNSRSRSSRVSGSDSLAPGDWLRGRRTKVP